MAWCGQSSAGPENKADLRGAARQASCIFAGRPRQNLHQPLLTSDATSVDQDEGMSKPQSQEVVMRIAGRGSLDYCDWWRDKAVGPDSASLFNVQLVGNASSPQLFTPIAHSDLAYCRYACCSTLLDFSWYCFALDCAEPENAQYDFVSAATGVTIGLWSMKQPDSQSI